MLWSFSLDKNWEIWAGPGLALLIEADDPDKKWLTSVMSKRYMAFEATPERALEIYERVGILARLGYTRGKAQITPSGDQDEGSDSVLRDPSGLPEEDGGLPAASGTGTPLETTS